MKVSTFTFYITSVLVHYYLWIMMKLLFFRVCLGNAGASALVLPPNAAFPCDLHDLESLHRRDLTLEEFHQQILQFVYNYAPGAATYIMEE